MAEAKTRQPAVPGWEQSLLWDLLDRSTRTEASGQALQSAVRQVLEPAQTLLVSGQTSPKDFTLHDAGHAFRVAELMVTLIPQDVRSTLTSFELALLLMAAYCHDIGMVPTISKEQQVLSFLRRHDTAELSETEVSQIERWLGDSPFDLRPHRRSRETTENLEYVAQLYIRSRHNDWSEDWIRANLSHVAFPSYSNWLSDLVSLCRSHHEGYERLVSPDFEPTLRGSPGRLVNLRYLACLLRLADVLEMDPARTPEIVFRHRLVHEKSQIYWAKDHQISPHVEADRIVIHARPSNARIHQAIKETVDQINTELRLCTRIQEEGRLEHSPGIGALSHRLDVPSSISDDVRPASNTYEFIDGSFRPNTKKLLELLGGHQLYGHDSIVAVRELLANALDSVKEAVALQRLQMDSPADAKWEEALGQLHLVSLRVEERVENGKSHMWLVCTDTGVGMTKRIIVNHLLVSGSARKFAVTELERRCRDSGFFLERTGQFGIGVLSYFLLADRVVIETRRSALYGDAEDTGWRFETDGIGTFGELKRIKKASPGTTVALRLSGYRREFDDDFFDDIERDFKGRHSHLPPLADYLRDLLVRVPCKVRVEQPGFDDLAMPPGWGCHSSTIGKTIQEEAKTREVKAELLKPIDGTLYGGELRFRITPYLLRNEERDIEGYKVPTPKGSLLTSTAYLIESWRGARIEAKDQKVETSYHLPCIIEVDWVGKDNAYVSVSRSNFSVASQDHILKEIEGQVGGQLAELRSHYSQVSLWEKLSYGFLPWPSEPTWLNHDCRIVTITGLVSQKLSDSNRRGFGFLGSTEIGFIEDLAESLYSSDLPKRVVFPDRRDGRIVPFVALDIDAYTGTLGQPKVLTADFPPNWNTVFGAYIDVPPFCSYVNSSNAFVEHVVRAVEPSQVPFLLNRVKKIFEDGQGRDIEVISNELKCVFDFVLSVIIEKCTV